MRSVKQSKLRNSFKCCKPASIADVMCQTQNDWIAKRAFHLRLLDPARDTRWRALIAPPNLPKSVPRHKDSESAQSVPGAGVDEVSMRHHEGLSEGLLETSKRKSVRARREGLNGFHASNLAVTIEPGMRSYSGKVQPRELILRLSMLSRP
jgi:hypothetical protein